MLRSGKKAIKMKQNELYIQLKNSLLSEDNTYQHLIDYCSDKLDKFQNYGTISDDEKKEIELYLEGLNEFFFLYVQEILNYKTEIAYNYFKILYNFFNYLELESRSTAYLSEYRIFAIRIMEIAFILQRYNLQTRDIFFTQKTSLEFYINLLDIYEINFLSKNQKKIRERQDAKVLRDTFKIKKDGIGIKSGNQEVYAFRSAVKIPRGYGTSDPTLEDYLKLHYNGVYQVYNNIALSKNKNGGGGGLAIKLEPLDPFPKNLYNEGKIIWLEKKTVNNRKSKTNTSTDYDHDEEQEAVAKSNRRITSPSNPSKPYGMNDSVKEYNSYIDKVSSDHTITTPKRTNKYKEILLNKSIGHLSAKANLYLSSQYNIPDINILGSFLSNIENKKSYEYKILVTIILIGIDIRQLFAMKLKLSRDVELVHKEYLRVNLTTAYAQTRNEALFKATKKYVEFSLPKFLLNYIDSIEEKLYEKLSGFIEKEKTFYNKDVEEEFHTCKSVVQLLDFLINNYGVLQSKKFLNQFLDKEVDSFQKYLQEKRKKYKKFIKITTKTLHLYSFHYYKLFHKESDIAHLFLKRKTSNIHTKLTYVASPTKIFNMTLWINELAKVLQIEHSEHIVNIADSKYSGSNKLVEPDEYKNFLTTLSKLEFENDNANLTLKMIYLRYVFCILLATRKYRFSCDLQEYSKRKKLLFLHEKAKHTYSSKRIVPITDLGFRYIEKFYQLKNEYNLQSFSPVIVDDEGNEEILSQANLLEWLHMHRDVIIKQWSNDRNELIEDFIINVVRDFGRHIFASESHNSRSLDQDYVDAFLNHFSRGTQDQGMYSSFDNKEYFKQLRELMNNIEKKYIPFWKEIGT